MKIRRSSRLFFVLVVVLAMFAAFAISCESNESSVTSGGGTTTPGDTTGVTDTEIKIGSLLPITGAASPWGIPMGQGLKAYFDYINAQGGIYGRQINLIIGDSGYTGPMGTEAAKQLIDQQQVFAFLGDIGTEVEAAVKDMIDANNIPDFTVLSGSSQFTDPVQKNRFTAMVNYTTEGKIFATYLGKTYAGKKLGILAQNDEYGREGGSATEQALKDSGAITDITIEWYDASMTDVTAQMQRLKADNVDVIMFWGGPLQAANMMKTARETLTWDVPLLVNEAAGVGDIAPLAGAKNMVGVVSTAITMQTDMNTNDVPGIVSRREIFQKYAPSDAAWNPMALAGMTTAESFVAYLRQVGPDLTREALIAAGESVCKVTSDLSMPGVSASTSSTDHASIEAEVFTKAALDPKDPTKVIFEPFGDPIDMESTKDCVTPTPPPDATKQPGWPTPTPNP
jgi:branched-chain amino acid transport system substrate-binding protein